MIADDFLLIMLQTEYNQNTILIMIINRITRSILGLLHRNCNSIISQKFYYGQGGELHFDLTKRSYDISIQTIWEDHSLLEIEGLTGVNSFTLYEQEGVSYFKDSQLQSKQTENIKVTLKIPQDYTFKGIVNGSLDHITSSVGKQMRSKPFQLEVIGQNHSLSMGDLKSQNINVTNKNGHINIPSLTIQQGKITCNKFQSKKLMTSNSIQLTSKFANLRSLIMFGKSIGRINCSHLEIQSISGLSQIRSQQLKIERYYGGQANINIWCKSIKDKLRIQTGTGAIHFETQEQAKQNYSKIELGKMHKGKLELNKNIVSIC